ncbi:MAG: CRISPR-associated endonuclease Cas2 [Armatimonadetes bacterium]|nr:CRISPR-associated endonuclease Cas2 [Armatimonadota bacterium]
MFVLVSYDIKSTKLRTRIAKIMESHGDRVQFSVFECNMEQPEMDRMMKRLGKQELDKGDSVRVYRICADCKGRITILGAGEVSEDPDLVIV